VTTARLIVRSLLFHARSHLGALLGAAIGSAVLTGALVVGDSVRESLRQMALARLGRVLLAMATGDRLFRAQLAAELPLTLSQRGIGQPGLLPGAPVLALPATGANSDGSARATEVTVLGVDNRFWQMAHEPPAFVEVPADAVVLNQALARQLEVRAGDQVLLRVRKPSALSRDAPLAPEEDATVALRLNVQAVVSDRQFGGFGLQASQLPPFNAFVSLGQLQARVEAAERANLLLLGEPKAPALPPGVTGPVALPTPVLPTNLVQVVNEVLRQRWQLADAALEWRDVPEAGVLELRSSRVFLDAAVGEAILSDALGTNSIPAQLARSLPQVQPGGVLTYFVNELRLGDRATPYSMVSAIGPPVTPVDLGDDEIVIGQWLADDLAARPGDLLTLTYYVVGAMRELEERSAQFRVRAAMPLGSPGWDRDLMPDFPGMTTSDNCRDWDTGLPIETDRIREKDEQYWDQYRGTPKALITLAAGRKLWQNRFGDLTAVRFYALGTNRPPQAMTSTYPGRVDGVRILQSYSRVLTPLLLQRLAPAEFGLRFQPVREQALAASEQSQDFGGLFIGFSLFLIAAALLLMALLFQFMVEQRATEVGTLLALGFTPRQVRRLLLCEGAVIALAGGLLGAWGGLGYARAMLRGLTTVWSDAVAGAGLEFHASTTTLVLGALAGMAVAWLTMWLALRRQAQQPAYALLAQGAELESPSATDPSRGKRSGAGMLATISGCLAAGLVAWAFARGESGTAPLFFGAGALLLLGGLAGCALALERLAGADVAGRLSLGGLGVRSATRRRRRSLGVVGLLACGSFLIASIGVFRLEPPSGASLRSAGTGGFALIGEATQPVIHDLDSSRGREAYGLDAPALGGVSVVPFRVRDGDDASCLNLNRAQQPRLLGVRPELLAQRGAFTFAKVASGLAKDNPWLLLRGHAGGAPDEVPAIGDAASIQWALGKRVGETLEYQDERGRTFKLRLVAAVANSVLQGNLVIAEDAFIARFPSATGYRMFLVDTPADALGPVAAELTRGLRDLGLELEPAARRLAAYNAVQNTYLGTFQVLGGLGLVLGSIGLGVVVLRNVLERRGELALLLAVGFRRGALCRVVLSEHVALLLAGLAVGVAAAGVAVLPSRLGPGVQVPFVSLALTLGAVLLNGAVWTWLATAAALRGNLLAALRDN